MNDPAPVPIEADELQQAVDCMHAGQVSEAARLIQPLLASRPEDYHVLHVAGTIALADLHFAEAAQYFHSAIGKAPDRQNEAMSWNGLGRALLGLHDLPQAEEALRRAMITDPATLSHTLEFAHALSSAKKYDLAIDVLRTAITRHPHDPAAYVRLGNVLINAGRERDALIYYDLALQKNPNYAPAHFNASVALAVLGKIKEAHQACDTALKLDPTIDGYYHLAKLGTVDEQRIAFLEARARDDSSAGIASQIDAGFALARIYDQAGEYDRAFNHLLRANRLKRSTVDFDINKEVERINRVKAYFTKDFFIRFQGKVDSALKPIFIVGMPRSGSTLVEQMLAAHPAVKAGGELEYMREVAWETGEAWGSRGPAAPGTDAEVIADLQRAAEKYTRLTAMLHKERAYFTDKLPGNFLFAGLIHLLFPKAAIIHTRRNPLDTCLSCFEQLFSTELQYAYDLEELGRYYRLYEQLMAHWQAVLPAGRILDIEYESLVKNPEHELQRMLTHCGLPFHERCLRFHEVQRAVTTASATQVRKPLYDSSVNRWQRYKEYLQPLADALNIALPQDSMQN